MVFPRNKGVLSIAYWLEWSLLWQEREGQLTIGNSILEKKKWLKEQLSGLFITKSLNLKAEECTLKPRVNIIIVMHLSTVTVWGGTKYSMVHGGKIWKWEKNTIFLSPINFFKSFSVTSRKKLDQGGKYYIVSPQAHIQETV